jgi:hypothetical protein
MPYNRTVDYQNSGDFLPDTVDGDNDRQVSQIKQVADLANRSVLFPQSLQNATSLSLPLPDSGLYLRWKTDLSGLENTGVPGVILPGVDVGLIADMVSSTTLSVGDSVFTNGYTATGDGGGRNYLVKTAAQAASDGDIIDEVKFGFTLATGDVAILQLVVNSTDYASFGSNIAGAISIPSHVAGSPVSDSASCTLEADKYYRLIIDITTTDAGFVKILFDGVDVIFNDQPDGLWFSNATILTNGTENNQILTTNLYSFSITTSATPYSTLSVETDSLWGGTVTGVTVEEITAREIANEITPSAGVGRNNNIGIKAGSFNRNDLALGNKTTLGAMTETGSPIAAQNVAIGSQALSINTHGDENTAIGTFALQGNEGSDNTAVGYSALKLNSKGQENTAVGYKAGVLVSTGYKNSFYGFWSGVYTRTGSENCHYGWRPNIAGGDNSNNSFYGSRAGSGILTGDSNVIIGQSACITALQTSTLTLATSVGVGAECKPFGNDSVTIGYQSKAGTEGAFADGAVSVGKGANAVNERSISVGFNASSQSTGAIAIGDTALATTDQSIAVGDGATASGSRSISIGDASSASGIQSVAVGPASVNSGDYVTSFGFRAGVAYTGDRNTFLGHDAGVQAAVAYTNCTLLGTQTAVTGSDQVQLGDASTTTYAYGAVQNRSDERDKLEIQNLTDEHIAFFMAVEWKQFRMNYRESYVEIIDGERVIHDNDESNAGSRFHIGAIAQQVEAAMNTHGVDFAGLQHHSVNGGEDVYSIGYQEFIGIQGEIIQRQQAQLTSILSRLDAAGI